jgi:hypothetical protein
MKKKILKSFGDLRPVTAQAADTSSPATRKSRPPPDDLTGRDIHEMVRRRETTPFADAIPYHHWGLNE